MNQNTPPPFATVPPGSPSSIRRVRVVTCVIVLFFFMIQGIYLNRIVLSLFVKHEIVRGGGRAVKKIDIRPPQR
jgi:hypothetical protein